METLRRLLKNVWIIPISIVVGGASAWIASKLGLNHYIPNFGDAVANAVNAALGSSATVYLIALTVQVEELRVTTQRAARDGIADGILGTLTIPNPRNIVKTYMTRLPHGGSKPELRQFVLESGARFAKTLEAAGTGNFESISLAIVAGGTAYSIDDLNFAVKALFDRYKEKFRYVTVLDKHSRNIIAAAPTVRGLALEIRQGDVKSMKEFLDILAREWSDSRLALAAAGFATHAFDVTNSPRELFDRFAVAETSEGLLSFDGVVVGMIDLWKLVGLALRPGKSAKSA